MDDTIETREDLKRRIQEVRGSMRYERRMVQTREAEAADDLRSSQEHAVSHRSIAAHRRVMLRRTAEAAELEARFDATPAADDIPQA